MSDPVDPTAQSAVRPAATPEQLARYAEAFNNSQMLRHFGLKVEFPEGKKVVARLSVRPEHRGGLGTTTAVNGGVLAALFDLVIGCTPALIDPSRRTATMQLSMSFERPVTGDSIRAEAQLDSAGSSTVFASAKIYDGAGAVCARCQGVARLGRIPWAGASPAGD